MEYIFETIDHAGRKIKLSKKQWSHIRQHHSEIESPHEIQETLKNPDKILYDEREDVVNYFKYFKHKKTNSKFLKAIVRYINSEGFVITAHFTRTIKWKEN
ncbi:MAG: hypothetical protein KJ592_03140 [Nanoarchaeota archaeon]|nr:hypothetical protein [Nanoarchaeota archaeon]